jgi:uncharacterized membrane protein YphA (DoxX/SURF4 family)
MMWMIYDTCSFYNIRLYRSTRGQETFTMTIVLWILQVLVAAAFFMAGATKAFQYEKARQQMKWVNDVPRGLVTFIAVCEMLGAIGLILPALTGVLPWLTPLAGAGLALVMLLASIFHAQRREYSGIVVNLVLLALAAFVAYGRFVIAPL